MRGKASARIPARGRARRLGEARRRAGAQGAGASATFAENFEFDVPVQLSKLDPAFTQGKVTCKVRGMSHDATTGLATGRANAVIGSGETSFAITQGAFNGPVSVKFNAR